MKANLFLCSLDFITGLILRNVAFEVSSCGRIISNNSNCPTFQIKIEEKEVILSNEDNHEIIWYNHETASINFSIYYPFNLPITNRIEQ